MLWNKNYPHAIVMRRWIIIAAFIFMGGLGLYIINLITKSASTTNSITDQNQTIHTYATENDVSWLKSNESSNKESTSLPLHTATQPSSDSQVANEQNSAQTPISMQNATQSNTSQQPETSEEQKAMMASISTNQITSDTPIPSSMNTLATMPNNSSSASANDDQNMQNEKKAFLTISGKENSDDYLSSSIQEPQSNLEIQAGSIIPAILITGINSDLPGQIIGQIRSNVYDSISGNYLLIPQGAKIVGLYDSQVAYGQERVLIVWNRIIFPNGKSIDLDGMPGIDLAGYSGFNDEVNNHYYKIFSSVLLMSALSAGAQLSQPQQNSNAFAAPSVGQTLAQSLGTNISSTGNMIAQKDLNMQPTLIIRPGYEFNISVTKDMVFPMVYTG